MEGENSLQWDFGVFLNSSLTREGGLISWRTNELTYIGGPGTKGLPGPRYELSGRPERACRAWKSPYRDRNREKKPKRAGESHGPGKFEEETEGEVRRVFFVWR